MTFFYR